MFFTRNLIKKFNIFDNAKQTLKTSKRYYKYNIIDDLVNYKIVHLNVPKCYKNKKLVEVKSYSNNFDICSDLHIDYWNPRYNLKYPLSKIIDRPFLWENEDRNKYLIVAGNISDDIDTSINYLNNISIYYDYVLFIDGNHEHIEKYPSLYSENKIYNKLKYINNNKLIYLSYTDFKINDTVIIGANGWWDYFNANEDIIKQNLDYFNSWIPHLCETQTLYFTINSITRAQNNYNNLIRNIEKYQNDESINNIILVSHTPPCKNNCNPLNIATEFNHKFDKIIESKYSKLNYWIYGHVHTKKIQYLKDIMYICNPRGKPENYHKNSEEYKLFKLYL